MKNYEQITNDLLRRRDKYVAEQRKKKKRFVVATASMCCVCIAVLMGIGVWRGEGFNTATQIDPNYSISAGNEDDRNNQTTQNQQGQMPTANDNSQSTNNPIVDNYDNNDFAKRIFAINEIDSTMDAALKYLDPKLHYTEEWDRNKVIDYLGADIIKAVSNVKYDANDFPFDMGVAYQGSGDVTVTYTNDGTLVRDYIGYEFTGNNGAKLTVFASKLGIPYDCLYSSSTDNKTVINIPETNEKVNLLVYAQDKTSASLGYNFYVIDFEYDGVYYRIIGENIRSICLDRVVREIVKS